MKKLLLGLALLSLTSLTFAQKKKNYSTVPSLMREAKEKGNVKQADSIAQDYINNYLFKLKEDELMTKDNLSFISKNLNTTDSRGFKLFFKQRNKINSILGQDNAEYAIRNTIAKQYIPKETGGNSPAIDWESIERIVTAKFGPLGQEMVYGKKMGYYASVKDWKDFGRYYQLYFQKALKRPEYVINNITWTLFENVNDLKVLKFACDVVMKYAMEEWYQTDVNAYDTYANLLYKTGQKEKGIEWEEKAVKLSNNDKVMVETLEKMKNNVATWNETANK